MKRMTKKQIIKSNIGLIIFSILCFLMTIIINYTYIVSLVPDYSELTEKKITVAEIGKYRSYRAGYTYTVETSDKETYHICGSYNIDDILEHSNTGTDTTIKYYEYRLLTKVKAIEELTVDGKKLVTYKNDNIISLIISIGISFLFFTIGIVCFFIYRFFVKHDLEQQRKRDKRIIKKYGKLNHKK